MIKKNQKKIFFYTALALLIAFLLFTLNVLTKKAQTFAVQYISKTIQSEIKKADKTGYFNWEKISVSFIPLKTTIEKATINIPKNNILPEPITINQLIIEPDYKALLLTGSLSAKITLSKSDLKIKWPKTINKKNQKPFSIPPIKQVPVSSLVLEDTNLIFKKQKREVSVKHLNAHIRLHTSKVTLNIQTHFMKMDPLPVFSLSTRITIQPKKILINQFYIKNKNSWLEVSATTQGDISSRKIKSNQTKAEGSFFLEDLTEVTRFFIPDFKIPLRGKITLKSALKYNPSSLLSGHLSLSAEKFFIQNVLFSRVQIKARLKNQVLSFSQFHIDHAGYGQIDLKQSTARLKKPYLFQAKARVKNSPLKDLFKIFNLNNIPLSSTVNGQGECKGAILDLKSLKCTINTQLYKVLIYGGRKEIILDIPKIKIQSQIAFNDNVWKADSTAELGEQSIITIKSELNEKEQFSSRYNGAVHFSDIKNLVNLKPEGVVNIKKGQITADKNTLQIQSQLDVKNLILSQFLLGNITTQLNYTEKGILRFRKINGQIKNSHYKGNLSINIFKNTIKLWTHFPHVTLQDLKHALANQVHFPFEITGTGALNGYLTGPLKVNALSYNLQSRFFKVRWEKEFFNNATIQLESKNGYVKTKKVELLKERGKILFQGQVDPTGEMTANMKGEGLKLQESWNISQITGPKTTGLIDFDMDLKGYFLNPITTAKVQIKNGFYKGYPFGDSEINLRLRRHQLEANGNVSNKLKIQNLIFPFQNTGLVELKATANNLNIKEIFSFIEGEYSPLYSQFQCHITGETQISYQKNRFLQSATGNIKINQLTARANSHTLTNQVPFSVHLKKGHIQTDPISLKSGTDFLNIIQQDSKRIQVSGSAKLDFLIFLFPFMRTWEGNINAHLFLNAKLFSLLPNGNLKIKNGFIQIHPNIESFEELHSDITVDNKTLRFQSIQIKIGGGVLRATGDLSFLTPTKIPVNIKGTFKKTRFESLPGIYTMGSGQMFLTGKTIPYTLGITADLEDSRIEKEFIGSRPDKAPVSPLLLLLEENKESFSPVNMRFNLYFKDPLLIENSTMKSSFSGKMKVTGSPLRPALSGTLKSLPGGKITFRDHEFDILPSRIDYSQDKPSNPLINLRARTLLRENSETANFPEEYNILLRVRGRGESPVFTLTSTPSMTENEIVSLLTFGARSARFEPGNPLNNIAKYSYYHLGPVLFQKAIGQELTDTLGLVDQFLIVPHISSKTNTTATKLILRKKMFNRLDLSSSHTLLDETRESDVKAKYKINKNISLIGLWQNETPEKDKKDKNPNTVGLDLEYQLDF